MRWTGMKQAMKWSVLNVESSMYELIKAKCGIIITENMRCGRLSTVDLLTKVSCLLNIPLKVIQNNI
jgi:hypothetical protein